MRTSTRTIFSVLACTLVLVSACRNRSGGDELPAEVQAAVDAVTKQIDAAAKAVGGAVEGFKSVDLTSDDVFGTCPTVEFLLESNVASIALTFEPGCTNDYYGDTTLSGGVSIVFDSNVDSFVAAFDSLTVDGQSTDGSLNVQRSADAADLRTWTGSIDIATSDVGSVVGDITLRIDFVRQTITIETASLTVSEEGGATYSVEIEGIVIRPVANESFVPEDGVVTFEMPNTDTAGPDTLTVEVVFDANSPVDGTVQVSISGGTIADYQLPGF